MTAGFVNVHTHSALTMVRGVAADLGFAPSYTKGIPNALDLAPEEAAVLARLGAVEALCFGSTLIGEHFVHLDACLPELAKLGLRVHASLRLHDVDFRAVAAAGEWRFDAAIGNGLLERNVAAYAAWHGKQDGRIAVQFAAHAADTCSEPYLARIAAEAHRRDAVVNTHLGQSKVEVERVRARTDKTPAQVFADAGLLDRRLLCGHCIYVDDARSPGSPCGRARRALRSATPPRAGSRRPRRSRARGSTSRSRPTRSTANGRADALGARDRAHPERRGR